MLVILVGLLVMDTTLQGEGGPFREQTEHMNILELKAILFTLNSYHMKAKNHIRIMCDSTSSIAYVNNMGGFKSDKCDNIGKSIWGICWSRQLWISAAHIPGVNKVIADQKSRTFNDNTEWMLNTSDFKNIISELEFRQTVDVFASRINFQIKNYIS